MMLLCFLSISYGQQDTDSEHRQAIEQARAGNYTDALSTLADLTQQVPEQDSYFYDYMVVLVWANQPAVALSLFTSRSVTLATVPNYVLEVLAKAARDQQNYQQAIRFYQALLAQQPDHLDARLGLALTLTDADDLNAASKQFDHLLTQFPNSTKILAGYGYWLNRSQRYADAARLFQRLLQDDITNTSAEDGLNVALTGLEGLAKTARNQGHLAQAKSVYEQVLTFRAERLQANLGLALTLTDSGQFKAAQAQFNKLLQNHPHSIQVLFAAAYLQNEAGNQLQRAYLFDRILKLEPANQDALRGRVLALAQIGAIHLAAELAHQQAALFSATELKQLRNDVAAFEIRWSQLPTTDPQQSANLQRPLQMLDWAARFKSLDLSQTADQRLAFDRLVALRNQGEMAAVIALYQRLIDATITPPDYALASVASAYLHLRQPEQALVLYQMLLKRAPKNYDLRLSLFYTLIELERHQQARLVIDALAADEAEWFYSADGKRRQENVRKVNATTTAALARAFADDLNEAQQRLQQLSEHAPANSDIRSELATIYRWRGWPDRALAHYQQILSIEPDLLSAQIGRAYALLERADFDAADAIISLLVAKHDKQPLVQKLKHERTLQQRRQLSLAATQLNTADGNQASQEQLSHVYLFSRPWQQRYRTFLHDYYSTAEFDEGIGRDHRLGIGIEYTGMTLSGRAEIHQGVLDNNAIGIAAQASWRLNDYWRLNAAGEINSTATPLRAIRAGIAADQVNAGVSYRRHESFNSHLQLHYSRFDDDNNRLSAQFNTTARIFNRPHLKITGEISVYGSRNSVIDAPYFNPQRDFSWQLSSQINWINYRRYEKHFTQHLNLALGGYWQQQFGSAKTWQLDYSHAWSLSQSLSFNYGVSRSRRVFDGNAEYSNAVSLGLELRF